MTAENRKKTAFLGWATLLVLLVIYSYSQVDLNLTLSANPLYQSVQKQLILLGYFHRPLSTAIYLAILAGLVFLHVVLLREAWRGNLRPKTVWKLAIVSAAILIFSYPAFSHDIFNYIFDARILVTHKANPWEFTALDFPQDLWTRFMRWTHRTYPYGPIWLLMTLPFYLAGLGKFSLTLFWFKVLGAGSYLLSVKCIREILQRISPKKVAFGMLLFALSPLVIVESLISSHIDIVMTALFIGAIAARMKEKNKTGWVLLIASAGVKFATAAAIPAFFWWKGHKEKREKSVLAMLILILGATAFAIISREILPWYFLSPLALVALLPERRLIAFLAVAASAGLLLRYAPYLYIGEYSGEVDVARNILTLIPVLLGILGIVWNRKKNFSLF